MEKAREVNPKLQELDAAFFDICYEFGEERMTKQHYEALRNTYEAIRQKTLGGEAIIQSKPPIVWSGRFVDINEKTGKLDIYDEDIQVLNSKDGEIFAEVKSKQDGNSKLWKYTGHYAGGFRVFSYKNMNNDTGIGTIFLEKSQDVYIGQWTAITCDHKYVARCPYILFETKSSSFFDEKMLKAGCQILDVRTFTWREYQPGTSCI